MKKYALFLFALVFLFGFFNINTSVANTSESSLNAEATTMLNGLFKKELNVGSKGEDVKILQKMLKDNGYLIGKIDGSYGLVTKKALIKFQKEKGLKQTGKADLYTLDKLKVVAWPKLCNFINENNGNEPDYVCSTN